MKTTDFTLAWIQKFDYNGKPYVYDKIDISSAEEIVISSLGKYSQYTTDQQANVMVILSDGICNKSSSTISQIFDPGEVIYLSTLLGKFTQSTRFYFANIKNFLNVQSFGVAGTLSNQAIQCAGTIYIYDFN